MCTYCYCGDHAFKWDRPWYQPRTPDPMRPWSPFIPKPAKVPESEWSLDRLKEYKKLLEEIHELEEKVGCECEPNKANYIELFKKRIEALEKKSDIDG